MRCGGEGEGRDDEVGDGEEGPNRCEYEKVHFGCGIPVGGDYKMSARLWGLSHTVLSHHLPTSPE